MAMATATTMTENLIDAVGGVIIDADGVVRMQTIADPQGRLHKQRMAAARAAMDPDLAKASPLRKISLNRLEAAINEQLEKGAKPTDEMRYSPASRACNTSSSIPTPTTWCSPDPPKALHRTWPVASAALDSKLPDDAVRRPRRRASRVLRPRPESKPR